MPLLRARARPARSCSRRIPRGVAGRRTPPRSRCRRCPTRDMRELLGRAPAAVGASPPTARSSLMRRAGGNPLYAREFVHMLEDRARLPATSRRTGAGRLDGQRSRHRAGADRRPPRCARAGRSIAAAGRGGRRRPVLAGRPRRRSSPRWSIWTAPLHELQRRGLIRRSPLSTIDGGERVRVRARADPRRRLRTAPPGRAGTHAPRGDEWLEAIGRRRGRGPQADLLASHAVRALDLARAAGMLDDDSPSSKARRCDSW